MLPLTVYKLMFCTFISNKNRRTRDGSFTRCLLKTSEDVQETIITIIVPIILMR